MQDFQTAIEMTELAHRISLLKGKRMIAEIVEGAQVSRETFAKIQRGNTVKLTTLKSIAVFLGATRDEWLELVVAWIKEEIGEDAKHLQIQPLGVPRKEGIDDASKINDLLLSFSEADRHQIIVCLHKLMSVFAEGKPSPHSKKKSR